MENDHSKQHAKIDIQPQESEENKNNDQPQITKFMLGDEYHQFDENDEV